MYLTREHAGYNRNGEQSAAGLFLILAGGYVPGEMRAAVRHVRMTQLGHFMMGSARLGADSVVLSGTYGADGLTVDHKGKLPNAYSTMLPVPEELCRALAKSDGWNGSGSEGPSVRKWALANLSALRAAGRRRS